MKKKKKKKFYSTGCTKVSASGNIFSYTFESIWDLAMWEREVAVGRTSERL